MIALSHKLRFHNASIHDFIYYKRMMATLQHYVPHIFKMKNKQIIL